MPSKVISNITKVFRSASGVLFGRKTAGTGRGEELTPSDVRTLISVYSTSEVDTIIGGLGALTSADIDTLAEINAILTDADIASVTYVDGLASNYATAAQGALADSALQPADIASGTITARADDVNLAGGSDGDVLTVQADGSLALETPSGGGGSGDVVGPASATDNAVARYDTTTGKLLQNSVVVINDSGNISGLGTVACGAISSGSYFTAYSGGSYALIHANSASNHLWLASRISNIGQVVIRDDGTGNTRDAVVLASSNRLCWSATGGNAYNTGADTSLARVSSGLVGIYTSLAGTVFGSLKVAGIQISSATGARAGNATLVAGTVTVTNTTVTANTIVYLTVKTAGGTIGNLSYTLSAGASFTINSDSASDTSVVSYFLIELN